MVNSLLKFKSFSFISVAEHLKYPHSNYSMVLKMRIRELLELVDEAIANVKVAIVVNKQRIFESPHTSWEFTQRSLELQNELDKLNKIKDYLIKLDPNEEAEKRFSKEEFEELLKYLTMLREMKEHEF